MHRYVDGIATIEYFLTHQATAETVVIFFTHGVRPSVRHKN